jgi:hypothetical protein
VIGLTQPACRVAERPRDRRRGSAVVETALVLPLFLAFWFGIIDWGITFFVHETVVHRANVAARWAAVHTYDADKIKNVLLHDNPTSTLGDSAWFSLQAPTIDVQLRGSETFSSRRIRISISNYQWLHFTPFFSGRFLGRPVVVTIPVEDLDSGS